MSQILLLTTCDADMRCMRGLVWPRSGPVDFLEGDEPARRGMGFYGALWGECPGYLVKWEHSAVWVVWESADSWAAGGGGNPRGVVVFAGPRQAAAEFIAARAPDKSVVGRVMVSSEAGLVAFGGDRSVLHSGPRSTLTAGDDSFLLGGEGSILKGGDDSTLLFCRGIPVPSGSYLVSLYIWRYVVAYVGQDGILPHQAYCLDEDGNVVEADKSP